jgi:hypothetical protein
MAQHEDLDRQVRVLAMGEPDKLEDATECQVEKQKSDGGILVGSTPPVKAQINELGQGFRHLQVPAGDGWSSGLSVRVGPTSFDEIAVPA